MRQEGDRVLYVHDLHAVTAERQFEFEEAYRDVMGPGHGSDDARLLWYLHAAHGSSDAYHVITITAVRDWEAWDRHVARLRYGDLSEWANATSALCYSARSTLLVSTDWSPLAGVTFDALPVEPVSEPHPIFREDVLEGDGLLERLEAGFTHPAEGDVLRLVAGFQPVLRSDDTAHVLYQVAPKADWEPAYGTDTGWGDWPGAIVATTPEGARGGGRILHGAPWAPMAKGWS